LLAANHLGRRSNGRDQPRVFVRRLSEDPLGKSLFSNFAFGKDNDPISDLGNHRDVVRHTDCSGIFFPDHFLENLQYLNLRRDVECSSWLIQNDELRLTDERHGAHQALQLAARNLMWKPAPQPLRIRQLQPPKEICCARVGFVRPTDAVENGRLRDLFADGQRGVKRGGDALRKIANPPTTQIAPLASVHGKNAVAFKKDLASRECEAWPTISQDGEANGSFSRSRFTDQADHLATLHAEADAIYDGNRLAIALPSVNSEVADF
jgi:hypothetical protein